MSGYVRKRNRKDGYVWQVIVNRGVGSNGERLRDYKTLPVGTTKKVAEQTLREMLTALDNQDYTKDSSITVEAYLRQWLEVYNQHKSPTTIKGYRRNLESYIIPQFGKLKLKDLTTLAIQKFYNSLYEKSSLSDKPLSAKSVKNLHIVFNAALKRAVLLELLKKNPAQNIELKKCKRYQADIYSEQELAQLFNAVRGTDFELPITILVTMGLRRGELLALTWEKIDFEHSTITIDQNFIHIDSKSIVKAPKTEASIRKIDAPNVLMDLLRRERVSYLERKLKHGRDFHDTNLVVCKDNGEAVLPDSLTQRFTRFLKRNGLRHLRIHDLRHENASLMLKAGVNPKIAQKRLGHSHYSTTMDTYSHILDGIEKDSVNLLESSLKTIMV